MVPLLIKVGRHDPLATAQDLLARRCASELERRGVRWRPLAHEHGLELGGPHRPGQRILARSQHAFLRDAELLADDPYLGWSLGAWDLRDLGLFGYSLLSAPDVGSALQLMVDRSALLSEAADLALQVDGAEAMLAHRLSANTASSAAWLHFFICTLEQLAGPEVAPLDLGVHQTDLVWLEGLAERIGRPVRGFEAPIAFLTFPAALLDRPIPGADAALLRTLDHAWENERLTLAANHAELAEVRDAILQLLPNAMPTASRIAMALGISTATLDAKLDRLGLGLHEIIDAVRAGQAVRILAQRNTNLDRAARLLGFSEPGALVQAHRRWWGTPPLDGRGRPLADGRR